MASTDKYARFVSDIRHRFHALTHQDKHVNFTYHPGPNYMILEDLSDKETTYECYTIVWADKKGVAQGMIDMKWIRNPVPEALGGILETRVYVDTPHRKKGIATKLYKQALAFTKALQQKAQMQAGKDCPVLLVEELLIPDIGTYKHMRDGMQRLLTRLQYIQSPHKRDMFTQIAASY